MRQILEAATCAAATIFFALTVPSAADGDITRQAPADALRHAVAQQAVPVHWVGPGYPGRRPDRPGRRIVLRGEVERGAECYILRTPRGDTWSLVGNGPFRPGQQVVVRGRLAEMSFCMQGRGTVEVERMHVLRRHGGGRHG